MSDVALPARVALVGNPNSGKTALFNALTGSRQKVANYPGVTVERKEGLVVTPAGLAVRLIDLPGTYSLRARSLDEIVTRDIVLGRLAAEDVHKVPPCVSSIAQMSMAGVSSIGGVSSRVGSGWAGSLSGFGGCVFERVTGVPPNCIKKFRRLASSRAAHFDAADSTVLLCSLPFVSNHETRSSGSVSAMSAT